MAQPLARLSPSNLRGPYEHRECSTNCERQQNDQKGNTRDSGRGRPVWTKWRNGSEFSAFEKEQMETYRARRSQGRERSLKDRRAILGYYFLSALRECLEKPDKWRQPADDDVRIFQGRLIAWTSAQRDR